MSTLNFNSGYNRNNFQNSARMYASSPHYNNYRNTQKSQIQNYLHKAKTHNSQFHNNQAHSNRFHQPQQQQQYNDPLTQKEKQIIQKKRATRPKRVTVVLGGAPDQKKKPEDFGLDVNNYLKYQTKKEKMKKENPNYFNIDVFNPEQNQPSGYQKYLHQREVRAHRNKRRARKKRKTRRSKSFNLNNNQLMMSRYEKPNRGTFVGAMSNGKKLAYGNQNGYQRQQQENGNMFSRFFS